MTGNYRVGQITHQEGCFTFEGYILGSPIYEIAYRLGLPKSRIVGGLYVAYALTVPDANSFELAGVTYDSTDAFVKYENGQPKYDAQKFKALYKGIDIDDIKNQYRNVFGENKLVKVLPAEPHRHGTHYPAGTIVPQFLMTKPLLCMVAAYIPPMGTFRNMGIVKV
jgi:hypothetical protein